MVYKFQCQFDADCIGWTILRLEVRVKQHILQELLSQPQNATPMSSQLQESAISDHLVDDYICRTNYSDDCFSVLYKSRSKQHLTFLEGILLFHYIALPCAGREVN